MRRLTILFVGLLSLSGCFAQRMELDDPMGLPLAEPVVQVEVLSQNEPALALQLQNELIQLLPRERQVRTQDGPTADGWALKIQLLSQHQQTALPVPLLNGLNAQPRTYLELKLAASLIAPAAKTAPDQHWEFVLRGDALPTAEAQLQQEMLRRLRDQLIQALQPRYKYL